MTRTDWGPDHTDTNTRLPAGEPALVCGSCGRAMRSWSEDPFDESSDCGGDCWGCIGPLEAKAADDEFYILLLAALEEDEREERAQEISATLGTVRPESVIEPLRVESDARELEA
jgi:hypothetical protein